jgi:hypothetical protein
MLVKATSPSSMAPMFRVYVYCDSIFIIDTMVKPYTYVILYKYTSVEACANLHVATDIT